MNRTFRLFSLLACLILASHSFAQDYDLEVDGIYYTYDTDKLTATVVAAPYQTPYSGNITIPATFTRGRFTFNVNTIDNNAFNSSKIESVTMLSDGENGVSSINGGAFSYCTYLKKVTFPSTLKTIGKSAFKNCSALPSIVIPSSVINIGNDAFSGCTALTNVKFPDVMSEKSIGDYAFDNCGITTLTLPRGVRQVGKYAFDHCKKLTKVNFPDDFGVISEGMFYDCTSLGEISFPSSLIAINVYAFCNCPLKKIVLSPAIIFISWSAFSGCKQLEEFIIEDGEEPLTCWLTENLPGLKTFYLGRNLDYDGDEERHLNPANLTIGPKVTSLLNIFGDDLKEITSYIKDPTSVPEYFSSKVKANAVLKVPAGSYNLYCNTNGWKDFFFIEKISGGNVVIDSNSFPDETFRNWVLAQDYGADGILTDKEIAEVNSIWVSETNITNMQGIEYFTALTDLTCFDNTQLTLLDVSKNTALTYLNCSYNQLTALDVSRNTALIHLYCESNQLTTLDVSKNTVLRTLYCSSNQLIALDVSKNTALTKLYCEANQLTSLNVSKNTVLKELCCGNKLLTALDVSNNTALTRLWCSNSQMASLNISKNTALTELACNNCQLTSLDISKNTALRVLKCFLNQLISLDVSKNTALTTLYCSSNQLIALDVSKNTALTSLNCSNNQLTALDVSKNTALQELQCPCNQIKGTAMSVLVAGLSKNGGRFYAIDPNNSSERNIVTKAQVAIAKEKGWITYYRNEGDWQEYEGSDNQPDGINSVNRDITGDRYYNLNGQRVEKPTKKGVYIVNGKKAVYKNQ